LANPSAELCLWVCYLAAAWLVARSITCAAYTSQFTRSYLWLNREAPVFRGILLAGPNLPAIVSRWSADEFIETIRTGVNPSGNPLNPDTMPWQNFSAAYTDEELRAIYEYIRVLPSRAEPSA
jgi:hypothetical protein